MILCFITLVAVFSGVANSFVIGLHENLETEFSRFMKEFEKEYNNDGERTHAFENFKHNYQMVKKSMQSKNSTKLGINQFSDLNSEEFSQQLHLRNNVIHRRENNLKSRLYERKSKRQRAEIPYDASADWTNLISSFTSSPDSESAFPERFDWRDHGIIGRVRNQGICGTCWAFQASAMTQSSAALRDGFVTELSVQEIVDCTRNDDVIGCKPYYPTEALEYVKANGLSNDEDYPQYSVGRSTKYDMCRRKSRSAHRTRIDSFMMLPQYDEHEMKRALVMKGPLGISFKLGSEFKDYDSGILLQSSSDCDDKHLESHAALLVGYGTENGVDYWIIKNSYGDRWGEDGYIRVERGVNWCEIAFDPMVAHIGKKDD